MYNINEVIIKEISKEDIGAMKLFTDALNKVDNLEIAVSDQMFEHMLAMPKTKDNVFVAYHNDLLIAFAGCMLSPDNDVDKAHFQLIIHPDYRRNGLGAKLYDMILERAKINNIKTIHCFCKERMKDSVIFVKKRDFNIKKFLWKMDFHLDQWSSQSQLPESYTVRAVAKEDINEYVSIMNDGFKKPEDVQYNEKSFDNLFIHLNNQLLLLEVNGEIVATAALRIEDEISRGFIFNVAVYSKHRGKGYGRIMLEQCVDIIKAAGVNKASLQVLGDNENALRLYKSIGFKEIETDIEFTLDESKE